MRIAILVNPEKKPLFTVKERVEIIRETYHGDPRISVDTFSGLLVDYAEKSGATVIVRGLRAISDFEYEFQMALMNRRLNPRIETVFMMPAEGYSYVSSRLVKEVVQLGGDVREPGASHRGAAAARQVRRRRAPGRAAAPQGVSAREPDGSAQDLSRRVLSLAESPTVAVAQRAAALRAAGTAVLDFSVGEPDQPTPRHVSEAAVVALANGRTRYTPTAGLPDLRAAVATRYRKDFRVAFTPEEVAITVGGKHALYLACQALLDRGDEVIIPSPHWPTFSEAVRLAGARPILVQTQEKDGFQITARMISKATSPRTKAVLINSPSNPTGSVVSAEDLLVIGDMAQRRKFTVLYDDTYGRLVYGKQDHSALQALRDAGADRFVILGTTSKSFCMTGWRIGWVMGPRPLVDACAALVSHSTQCPTTFAQMGAIEALTGPQRFVHDLAAELLRRRDLMHAALTAVPGVSCVRPAGAFYLFPNVGRYLSSAVPNTLEMARRLLEEKGVAVVPGEAFTAPGHLRISFARPVDELKQGAERIASFLAGLRGD